MPIGVGQIADGSIVDAVTRNHLIGNAGDLRDLGWDRPSTRLAEKEKAEVAASGGAADNRVFAKS